MEQYILKYLYDCTSDEAMKRLLDYCKFQLDCRLWSAGRNFPYSFDTMREWTLYGLRKKQTLRYKIKERIHHLCSIFSTHTQERVLYKPFPTARTSDKPYTVLSLVSISEEVRKRIEEEGIAYYNVNLDDSCITGYITPAMVKLNVWYHTYVRNAVFNELIQQQNAIYLDTLYHQLVEELRVLPIDAVLVRTSEMFFEKLMIDAFKELGKPSITLLHGLPGMYSKTTEGRSDYLLVWGEKIRENFIKIGYVQNRVLVAGNYKYNVIPKHKLLRNTKDDVLVLTSTSFAEHQHEWEWDKFTILDRGLLITYLYSIENVLKRAGISKARLRPHPAVNGEWLMEYVDGNFYSLDKMSISESLLQATLCVGPTSSTFLEALMFGVTYIPYEPSKDGKIGMGNRKIIPPFDGTEPTLKIAYTEEQLLEKVKSHSNINFDMDEWMQGFDANVIKKILEDR